MPNKINIPKPKKLSYAIILLIVSVILGVINYFVITQTSPKWFIYSFYRRFFSTLFTYSIQLFLIYQISISKKWARNTFLILLILDILVQFSAIASFKFNSIVGFISVVSSVLQIIAIIMIYSKESNEWFNLRNMQQNNRNL